MRAATAWDDGGKDDLPGTCTARSANILRPNRTLAPGPACKHHKTEQSDMHSICSMTATGTLAQPPTAALADATTAQPLEATGWRLNDRYALHLCLLG